MTNPYPFQSEDMKRMEHFEGRVLLAWEMGLGKSFQSLLYAKQNNLSPVIIVCPASLKWNWEREAAKHVQMRAEIIEGTKAPKTKWTLTRPKIVIINYDILTPQWIKLLRRLKPQLVIVDEGHYIQSIKTRRTKAVKKLCKGIKYILCLTGTPMTNRPRNLWPMLNLLQPNHFPNFHEFGHRYCRPEWTRWGWKFDGASHLDELRDMLHLTCMIRRLKTEVLKELPEKQRIVIPMSIQKRSEYDHALQDFAAWLRQTHPGVSRRILKAEELVKAGYLKRLVAELKLPGVFEWVENFLQDTDGKLILFAIHTKIIRALHEKFKNCSTYVDGSVTGRKRQVAIDQFQHDKKTRIIVGQLQAASVGWNGTAATAVAFAELGWTPGEHDQAEGRAHRIGQHNAISCYYLVGRNTIEDKLCKLLHSKQKNLTRILDGNGDGLGSSAFEELLVNIKKGK
jgi:SWI/SNF-related matrix-associated actin-dependent regulator 1 of chromatin subfamily A